MVLADNKKGTMMSNQATEMESSFVKLARYPKGKKTLQAILDATYELITTEGLAGTSQEAIARRANVTQSAVRHYFPTKDALMVAFFSTGIERLESVLETRIANPLEEPIEQLLDVASLHYDRILAVEDIYFFESAAFWGRNPDLRSLRERWYQRIDKYYCQLISQIHPDWEDRRCKDASFQVMTLIMGSWITMGNSRAFQKRRSRKSLKAALLRGIEKLID